jgi:hypothetical protein
MQTSPLSAEADVPLIWDELRRRLLRAEEEEVKRVLGWGLIERNDALASEARALSDMLAEFRRATTTTRRGGPRRGPAGETEAGPCPSPSPSPPRRLRRPRAQASHATDASERSLLEAQIGFFVDKLRGASVPLPPAAAKAAAAAAASAAASAPSSASRHGSGRARPGTGGEGAALGSRAGFGPTASRPTSSATASGRPQTGSSVGHASVGSGGSGGASSYLSAREALESAGLAGEGRVESVRLWDDADPEVARSVAALREALEAEGEALAADLVWLQEQLEAAADLAGLDVREEEEEDGDEDDEDEDGRESLDALRAAKRDLQRKWLEVEEGHAAKTAEAERGKANAGGAAAAPSSLATREMGGPAVPPSERGEDAGAGRGGVGGGSKAVSRLRALRGLPKTADGGETGPGAAAAAAAAAAKAKAEDEEARFF